MITTVEDKLMFDTQEIRGKNFSVIMFVKNDKDRNIAK